MIVQKNNMIEMIRQGVCPGLKRWLETVYRGLGSGSLVGLGGLELESPNPR